ncbi:MAG TPA: hypothetical protein VHI77_02775 [Solirubrobacterales bacterium]|jgi:cytochrome c-type biogenesis protein CcmH/NrfF|nr:hypothetical protein [Solirubrobacterales bacterium]
MPCASLLPLAHLGHWLWVFYVLPVLIVVLGILWSTIAARRRERGEAGESDDGG